MRGRLVLAVAAAMAAAPALSHQALSQATSTPDRIISDRPAREERPPANIQPRNQSAVQLHGEWVDDTAQCRSAMDDESGSGVYLTDTLLRWGRNTCSIRDISTTAQGALLDAMCVSDEGRSRTTFTLARQAPDRMRIISANGVDTATLLRCPQG